MTYLPENLSTLVDVLRWRADHQPDRTAFTFLVDGGGYEAHLSYEQLDARSRSIAASLQALHAEGERALLLFPPGLDFICAFFGALYAGVIAVPCQPPRPGGAIRPFQAILSDTGARYVLGTSELSARSIRALEGTIADTHLRWLATDDRARLADPDDWARPDIRGETLAFLQHTSGSVSRPRGVQVSHRNLLSNERMIATAFEHDEDSTVVGWLPIYHDMGLIGNVLQPVYVGSRCILMPPASFLQRPMSWLQAISRYRARTSGGPNFAYDLCVDKMVPDQCVELDLSCWTLAFNGSEPVHAQTLDRFCTAFAGHGFRRQAFYPCYGLAEATLLVTGGRRSTPPVSLHVDKELLSSGRATSRPPDDAKAVPVIGCGRDLLDETVTIVDPETSRPCAADQVGEVWVAGSNVCSGYWNNPEQTADVFGARVTDASGTSGPYLRTGDLGFLHEGQLFIVGRRKDVIIIRGRNYWPQDLERTATRCHPSLRAGRGAAFSIEEGTQERLVLVLELARRRRSAPAVEEELFQTIRAAISLEHELQVHTVVLVDAGTIPITSSGKVRRRLCKQMLSNGELSVAGRDLATPQGVERPAARLTREALIATESSRRLALLESYLVASVTDLLHRPLARVPVDASLAALGLDSLSVMELGHRLQVDLGVTLAISCLYETSGLSAIARVVLERIAATPSRSNDAASSGDGHDVDAPMSHGQRALWFLQRLAPHGTAYNITVAAAIRGELDAEWLRRAFQQLVDRHASLRSTFDSERGEPVCTIHETQEVCFIHRAGFEGGQELTEAQMVEGARHAFDLQKGPLLRVTVFTKSPRSHVLVLTAHHLIADFWSLARLLRELNVIHAAEASGAPASLPSPTTTHADHVARQRRLLKGERGEQLERFWRAQLAGQQFDLSLPLDRPRTSQPPRVEAQLFELSPRTTAQLGRLAQRHDASLYTVLLAAWQVLLFRICRQERFTIGSLTSGRHAGELADVIGYFVNPVVLPSDVSGDPSIDELVAAARKTVVSVLAHSEYPFPRLVEELGPARNYGRAPLFRTMLNWQQSPLRAHPGLTALALGCRGGEIELGPLTLESLPVRRERIDVDLEMELGEIGGRLQGLLVYDANLFDASSIDWMVGYFSELTSHMAEEPRQRISSLPVVSRPATRRTSPPERRAGPCERTLNDLLRQQVERTPDKIALVGGDTYSSYSALARQVERVANSIAELRARSSRSAAEAPASEEPGGRELGRLPLVALLLQRSPHFVVSAFGVLESGNGFVPLDSRDPVERLQFMLADCGIDVLVTEQALLGKAIELCRGCPGVRDVIVLDVAAGPVETGAEVRVHGLDEIARCTTASTRTATVAEQVAYVVYTSGTTTGVPKGVPITHANLVPLVEWHRDHLSSNESARTMQTLSVSFDVGLWEVLGTVLSGGTLYLEEELVRLGRHRYIDYVNRHGINTINATPTFIRELLDGDCLTSVGVIMLIGETLEKELLARIFERVPGDCRVINAYGPTEATVFATMQPTDRASSGRFSHSNSVPIGTVTADSTVYLLDAAAEAAPPGVPGEIYIGGPGIALGYLNRPELTAARFLPDHSGTKPGARLYRTGDMAIGLADGTIEFLGRIDLQVKIRGFRVEPQEVEAALKQHPAVFEAAVLPMDGPGGDKQLWAYIVARPGHRVVAGELLQFARRRVPDYMIPAVLSLVDSLPRTSSGKLDRRAIEQFTGTRLEALGSSEPPRTDLEKLVADAWREELEVDRIGLDDNFFDLGGHSLMASRVHARLVEHRGQDFPLAILFEYTDTRSLAAYLSRAAVEATSYDEALDAPSGSAAGLRGKR